MTLAERTDYQDLSGSWNLLNDFFIITLYALLGVLDLGGVVYSLIAKIIIIKQTNKNNAANYAYIFVGG